jgi:dCTP deaminase
MIKSDRWIRRMAKAHRMIEPFEPGQVREANGHRIVSYGTSSYGYDIRCSNEFKIFTNINSTIVDPKKFDEGSFVDFVGDVCIIPPNSFALARTIEYFRIPRNVLVACLGKSTYARCFRGDTRVALVDGTSPTLQEMARRADSGELFWGYSIGERGRVIVSLLDAPRHIGVDSLLEIELDNGELIHTTADHEFILRDGALQQAADLRPGRSLMPLYRDLVRGHETVYQPVGNHMVATHRLADEWNLRARIYSEETGTHRHHIDLDRRNNRPTNIRRLPASDPIRLHNDENYGEGFDAEAHGDAIRHALRRLGSDRAWQERFTALQSKRARVERYRDPQERLRQGELSAAAWARDFQPPGSDASHRLGCDRTVFRRFPDDIARFRGMRNHKVAAVRELPGQHDVFCLTVPEAGNFALEAGVFVKNCGIIVNVTPLEPEWEGHVTLEFSNTTPLPAKIYANEGVAQVIFFESDEVCETSYKDRGGKYQGQQGVTLPKL